MKLASIGKFNLLVLLLIVLVFPTTTQAITLITEVNVDTLALEKGFTLSNQDGNFKLGIFPGALSEETRVVLKQLDKTEFTFPDGWTALSDVYEFKVENEAAFKNKKPLVMRISAEEETTQLKKIFSWNDQKNVWNELSATVADNKTVAALIRLSSAKVVLLKHDSILQFGEASWYKYKNCLCAASPDFPKSTKLRVRNLDNKKEVVVTVNDFGPDRGLFPKRIIDLDKTAFKKLGALGRGILKNISVEEVKSK